MAFVLIMRMAEVGVTAFGTGNSNDTSTPFNDRVASVVATVPDAENGPNAGPPSWEKTSIVNPA